MMMNLKEETLNSEALSTTTNDNKNTLSWHHLACSSCHGNIRGMRYKCLECVDYDLCRGCESLGRHEEHDMMRLVTPLVVMTNMSAAELLNKKNDEEHLRNKRRTLMLSFVHNHLWEDEDEDNDNDNDGIASRQLNDTDSLATKEKTSQQSTLQVDEGEVEAEMVEMEKNDPEYTPHGITRAQKKKQSIVIDSNVNSAEITMPRKRGRPRSTTTTTTKRKSASGQPGRPKMDLVMDRNVIKTPTSLRENPQPSSQDSTTSPGQNSDSPTGEHSCNLCPKVFKTPRRLRDHEVLSHGPKNRACHFCGKLFAVRSDLIKHIRVHTGEKPFKCEVCARPFTLKAQVSAHMYVHTREKRFPCPLCDKFFSRKALMRDHLANRHSKSSQAKLICSFCSREYKNQKFLAKHMEKQHGVYEIPKAGVDANADANTVVYREGKIDEVVVFNIDNVLLEKLPNNEIVKRVTLVRKAAAKKK